VTPNVSRELTEATDALPGHTPETERALTEATPVGGPIALKALEATAAKQQRGA
jgi:hypothetical protein